MRYIEHVLLHRMPKEALRKAHDLALRLERDRTFRLYVVRNLWLWLPMWMLASLVLLAAAIAVVALVFQIFPEPSYRFLRYGVLALAAAAWILTTSALLYVAFTAMERRMTATLERRKLQRALRQADD